MCRIIPPSWPLTRSSRASYLRCSSESRHLTFAMSFMHAVSVFLDRSTLSIRSSDHCHLSQSSRKLCPAAPDVIVGTRRQSRRSNECPEISTSSLSFSQSSLSALVTLSPPLSHFNLSFASPRSSTALPCHCSDHQLPQPVITPPYPPFGLLRKLVKSQVTTQFFVPFLSASKIAVSGKAVQRDGPLGGHWMPFGLDFA